MKKAFSILLTVSLYFSNFVLAQETTKPDTVIIDKNKDQVLPPKSESTNEAPKKAEVRDSTVRDTIPKVKGPKITDKRRGNKKKASH
jgi:hypothetical protein